MRTLNEEKGWLLQVVGANPYCLLSMWDQHGFSSLRGLAASISKLQDESPLGKVWPGSCPGVEEVVCWRSMHLLRRGPDMIGVSEQVQFLAGSKGYVHTWLRKAIRNVLNQIEKELGRELQKDCRNDVKMFTS